MADLIIPTGFAVTDPLSITAINYLTQIAIEPLLFLLNLWNGAASGQIGIGKPIIMILISMLIASIALDFFQFIQDMVRKSFSGWGNG
jgi:hypothetical protein